MIIFQLLIINHDAAFIIFYRFPDGSPMLMPMVLNDLIRLIAHSSRQFNLAIL
jgi:hypothetical protein